MTRKLFEIERFSFSNTGERIIVSTTKGCHSIDKEKFQRWVDWDDKRGALTWDEYYLSEMAETDLYDYIVIMFAKDMFGDIKRDIDIVTRSANY